MTETSRRRERCPCCGRLKPATPFVRKFATAEERWAHLRRVHAESTRQRMERDRPMWALVPNVFASRDVGRAMRQVGRHWSELQGAIGRAIRFGAVLDLGVTVDGKRFEKLGDLRSPEPSIPDGSIPEEPLMADEQNPTQNAPQTDQPSDAPKTAPPPPDMPKEDAPEQPSEHSPVGTTTTTTAKTEPA